MGDPPSGRDLWACFLTFAATTYMCLVSPTCPTTPSHPRCPPDTVDVLWHKRKRYLSEAPRCLPCHVEPAYVEEAKVRRGAGAGAGGWVGTRVRACVLCGGVQAGPGLRGNVDRPPSLQPSVCVCAPYACNGAAACSLAHTTPGLLSPHISRCGPTRTRPSGPPGRRRCNSTSRPYRRPAAHARPSWPASSHST